MASIKGPGDEFPGVFSISEEEKSYIDSVLDKMTIRERVAQMIMPWASGSFTSDTSSDYRRIKYLVEDLKVGGLVYFKGDILNEALNINKAQELAKVPLLISSDFERGLAMRLTDATEFPYNMALAAAGNPFFAEEMGKTISQESRIIGIHQNYAPVADINVNADNPIINIRAYSEDKDVVSEYCEAFIRGSRQGGMITTVKHFPGHGNTSTDSHQDMPVISGTREELMTNELDPFIKAINSGVQSVMIGHLSVPAFEPDNIPATLSKRIITDLLKNELQFKGLVVTDAMNMNAVTRYYSVAQASVMAIKAGIDILLMPPDEDIAVSSISDAVYSGEIPVERINESVRKILAAKVWTGVDKIKTTDIASIPSFVGSRKNVFIAEEIAEKSITLVKNENNIIPLAPEKFYSTAVISITDNVTEGEYFNELCDQEFGYIKTITLGSTSSDKDFRKAMSIARSSDLIIIPSFVKVKAYQGTVLMKEKQAEFVNQVLQLDKPSLIISFGNPYLLSMFPGAGTYIATYGDAVVSQKAVLRAITGKTDITGKLPVTIPGTPFKRGDGINITRNMLVEDAEGYDVPAAARIISENIESKMYPGASLLISCNGKVIYNRGFGKTDFDERSPVINKDFLYDIDRVTTLAVTAAAMVLASEEKINPDDKLLKYMPDIKNNNLLVKDLFVSLNNPDNIRNIAAAGAEDNSADVLKKLIERISGMTLDEFLNEKIFVPLEMQHTMFNPPKASWFYAVPTSDDPHRRYKGVVFDDEALKLHGVAGHSGLFTTTSDWAKFLQMLHQKGKYGNKQIISESIFDSWYPDSGAVLYLAGKTGTAVWMNRSQNISVILFTNSSFTGRTAELGKTAAELYDSILSYVKL